jgi:spore maturation protein SpmA
MPDNVGVIEQLNRQPRTAARRRGVIVRTLNTSSDFLMPLTAMAVRQRFTDILPDFLGSDFGPSSLTVIILTQLS